MNTVVVICLITLSFEVYSYGLATALLSQQTTSSVHAPPSAGGYSAQDQGYAISGGGSATALIDYSADQSALSSGEALVASYNTNAAAATQTISQSLSDPRNAVAFSEGLASALALGGDGIATAISDAIVKSFDGGVVEAIGQAIASLSDAGYIIAASQAIVAGVQDGFVQQVFMSFAESFCTAAYGLADVSLAACNEGDDIAEAIAIALVIAADNCDAVATAESFVAVTTECDYRKAFVSSYGEAASEINCEAASQALAEASAIEGGNSQGVADAQNATECLNVPLIVLRPVECNRFVQPCRASSAGCCVSDITSVMPGFQCDAGFRPAIYSGKCSDSNAILVEPSLGSGCACPY